MKMNLLKKMLKCSVLVMTLSAQAHANDFDPMIVGGHEATPHSYPFIASLQYKSSGFHFCGGTLINKNTVLTAAHCLRGQDAKRLQVVLGDHNLAQNEGTEQVLAVDSIMIHPKYSPWKMNNDVGIIHLAQAVELNEYVATLDLPYQGEEFIGETTVIGWGTLASGGATPDELNEVDVSLMSDANCKAAYGSDKIYPGMICAGASGKDSCQGDSGGPLFQNGVLVGIVSWGYGCASPGYPGVYTNASTFADFIQENS